MKFRFLIFAVAALVLVGCTQPRKSTIAPPQPQQQPENEKATDYSIEKAVDDPGSFVNRPIRIKGLATLHPEVVGIDYCGQGIGACSTTDLSLDNRIRLGECLSYSSSNTTWECSPDLQVGKYYQVIGAWQKAGDNFKFSIKNFIEIPPTETQIYLSNSGYTPIEVKSNLPTPKYKLYSADGALKDLGYTSIAHFIIDRKDNVPSDITLNNKLLHISKIDVGKRQEGGVYIYINNAEDPVRQGNYALTIRCAGEGTCSPSPYELSGFMSQGNIIWKEYTKEGQLGYIYKKAHAQEPVISAIDYDEATNQWNYIQISVVIK